MSNYVSKPRQKKVYRVDDKTGGLTEVKSGASSGASKNTGGLSSNANSSLPINTNTGMNSKWATATLNTQPKSSQSNSGYNRSDANRLAWLQFVDSMDGNGLAYQPNLLGRYNALMLGALSGAPTTEHRQSEISSLTEKRDAARASAAEDLAQIENLKTDDFSEYALPFAMSVLGNPKPLAIKALTGTKSSDAINKLEDENSGVVPTLLQRGLTGIAAVVGKAKSGLPYMVETLGQTLKDNANIREQKNYSSNTERLAALSNELTNARDLYNPDDPASVQHVKDLEDEIKSITAGQEALRNPTPDTGVGAQGMKRATSAWGTTTLGMGKQGKYLTETGMSVLENAAYAPMGPAAALALMGVNAAAQKSYDVTQSGGNSADALTRGALAGLIEVATEKIPLENVLRLAKGGSATEVKDLLKQVFTEASEESISYVADDLIDRAYGDKSVPKTWAEYLGGLGESALGGALSGGVMGAGGMAIGNYVDDVRYQAMAEAERGQETEQATSFTGTEETAPQAATAAQEARVKPIPIAPAAIQSQQVKPIPYNNNGLTNTTGAEYNQNNGGVLNGEKNILGKADARADDRGMGYQYSDRGNSEAGGYSAAAGESERGGTGLYQTVQEGWGYGRNNNGVSPGVRVISQQTRDSLTAKGIPDVSLQSSNEDYRVFSSSLDKAKQSNQYGAYVDGRTAEQLQNENANTLLSRDGTAGIAVLPSGNIVGAFKDDSRNKIKQVSGDLLITAIENGGDRLDCYGENLAKMYWPYGFTPVAKVKYEYGINSEMDNTVRRLLSEGKIDSEPYIYFMKSSGESAQTVASKIGQYPPLNFDVREMSYEEAEVYCDSLIDKAVKEAQKTASKRIPTAEEAAANIERTRVLKDIQARDGEKTMDAAGKSSAPKPIPYAGAANIEKVTQKVEQTQAPKFDQTATDAVDTADMDIPVGGNREKIAEVLTHTTKQSVKLKDKFSESYDYLMRQLVDTGHTIDRLGKRTGDKQLYAYYNNAKQGRTSAEYAIDTAQTDLTGNVVGDSLKSIFDPVKKQGDAYTKDFFTYLLHRHNADRMSLNERGFGEDKPVFGDVTAFESTQEAARLLKEHSEFEQLAEKVYSYNRNQMQLRIDAGMVSQKQAALMEEMYPHYVPTYRDMVGTSGSSLARNRSVKINSGIKKATGGSSDIMPLDVSMARQTMQAYQAAKRNIFGNRLLDDALHHQKDVGDLIYAINKSEDLFDIDAHDAPNLDNTFTVYRDGKPYTMQVNNGIFMGVEALSYVPKESSRIIKGLTQANTIYKQLITGYNPFFTVKNFARDLQDAGIYSQDLSKFVQNYPRAWKEIATNGKLWQQYQALGGTASSVFDYDKGIMTDAGWLKANTVDRVEALNMAVEQAPRFTEFITLAEKGDGSYDSLMNAMLGAADVTVNFGRSGKAVNWLNKTLVPFLNPSIQGTNKLVRTLTSKKSFRAWAKLVVKCAVLGVLPQIVNGLVYRDDREYEEMTDYNKDANYVFKLDNGEWLKIPKGRILSVLGSAARRTVEYFDGREDAFEGFGKYAIDQIGPQNPVTSNFFSPIINAANNKTWYGGNIESQRLQNLAPGERYDESTDSISKAIGGALNISPKKINYVIDAYSGVVGDTLLPLLTPKAEQDPFKKAFTIDTVTSNRLSNDFYSLMDDANYRKNSYGGTPADSAEYSYLSKQGSKASDIFNEIRVVENSSLSGKEKLARVRELREQVNEIYRNAIGNNRKFSEAFNELYAEESKWMGYNSTYNRLSGNAKEKADEDLYKLSYAVAALTVGEDIDDQWIHRAVELNRDYDVSYSDYATLYGAFSEYEGDDSAEEKRKALMNYAGLTAEQKNATDSAMLNYGEESRRDYTSAETFTITSMSEAAQYKWTSVKSRGISYQIYKDMYDTYYKGGIPSKENGIKRLLNAGYTQEQAYWYYVNVINNKSGYGGSETPEKKAEILSRGMPESWYERAIAAYSGYGTKEERIDRMRKAGLTREQAEWFYAMMN